MKGINKNENRKIYYSNFISHIFIVIIFKLLPFFLYFRIKKTSYQLLII